MKHKSQGILTFLLATFASLVIYAQQPTGYKLDFRIAGLKDTTLLLGFYYGESSFAKDTARANSKGEFTFDGKRPLPHGVYFLALDQSKDKTRIFELLISDDQHFMMETNTADYVKNMKVTGDADNKLFFENMLFNMERHKEAEPYLEIIKDSTESEDKKKTAREAFGMINDKVLAYQTDIIEKKPQHTHG
jgi:hypothetical protein